MSSLGATQSDGYYLPPEYFTSGAYKHQSKNEFQKSKGHNQFLQNGVVRFELPYDGFCLECNAHVGKGTRFNAKKKFSGDSYFTTKIWDFEMKCRACAKCIFLIKTNPKDRCFDYVKGIKKKVEEFDTVEAETLGVIETDVDANSSGNIMPYSMNSNNHNDEEQRNNPIDRLENVAKGERKAMTERDKMEALYNIQSKTMCDDAGSNSVLRSKYRTKRKERRKMQKETESLGLGKGILLPSREEVKVCELQAFKRRHERSERRLREEVKSRWNNVRMNSIFNSSKEQKVHKKKRKKKLGNQIVDQLPMKNEDELNRAPTKAKIRNSGLEERSKNENGISKNSGQEQDSAVANLFNYTSDSE